MTDETVDRGILAQEISDDRAKAARRRELASAGFVDAPRSDTGALEIVPHVKHARTLQDRTSLQIRAGAAVPAGGAAGGDPLGAVQCAFAAVMVLVLLWALVLARKGGGKKEERG